MRGSGPRSYTQLALVSGLLAALALLAVLQNRWITSLAEAERDRLGASLQSSSTRFCDDFDRELTRASQVFRLPQGVPDEDLAGVLAARLARWRSVAPTPRLVRELLVVTRGEGGSAAVRRFEEGTGRIEPAEWDATLASVHEVFSTRGPVPILDEQLPGIILPVRWPLDGDDRRPPLHHVIVRLDREFIAAELFPRSAASLFGGQGGLDYAVLVRETTRPDDVIYSAGPRVVGGAAAVAAVTRPLFSLRFFPEFQAAVPDDEAKAPRQAPGERRGVPAGQPPPRPAEDRPEPRERAGDDPPRVRRPGVEAGRWTLEVRHPAGSLEEAVAAARRRNLAVSLAIVSLLGVVGALMVVSTRRAQRLALQQMSFVANVSHELRTPLTAMRSAGQNLADGIVGDPERVRRYGALIEREGRRLTEMVDRVLAFAGMQSGRQSLQLRPLEVGPLVLAVLADSRWVLEEKGVEVETDLAAELPPVRGDAAALRQALSNLIDNSMKYGATARWLGVRAASVSTPGGAEVEISVSDRGPGIRRADLSRLFEPFFRGGDARAEGTPGSGLGLAVVRGIVEAHHGRISVDSAPGRGSTFTIHLPALVSGEGA